MKAEEEDGLYPPDSLPEVAFWHFWVAGIALQLSHVRCQERKKRSSRPALRAVVTSMDFSAGRNMA